MSSNFSKNLITLRNEKKLSQKMLATIIGVTQQCVSEWELGHTEPTLTFIWKIADVFEVSMQELVTEEII